MRQPIDEPAVRVFIGFPKHASQSTQQCSERVMLRLEIVIKTRSRYPRLDGNRLDIQLRHGFFCKQAFEGVQYQIVPSARDTFADPTIRFALFAIHHFARTALSYQFENSLS